MGLKFQNPKFKISCKTAFNIFFIIKCENFGVNRSIRLLWNKKERIFESINASACLKR